MLSLLRKYSSTAIARQESHNNNMQRESEEERLERPEEEVDARTFDPSADPRDPGTYWTFPRFGDGRKQGSEVTGQDYTTRRQDSPKSNSPAYQATPQKPQKSKDDNADISPPFWPDSPSRLQQRRIARSPKSPSSQRRATADQVPLTPKLQRRSTADYAPLTPTKQRVSRTREQMGAESPELKGRSEPMVSVSPGSERRPEQRRAFTQVARPPGGRGWECS